MRDGGDESIHVPELGIDLGVWMLASAGANITNQEIEHSVSNVLWGSSLNANLK